jgi:hypothetical protein
MAGGRGLLAAALLVLGASVPASWSWSMTASVAPRAGPSPRTALHALQPMYRRAPGCRSAVVGGRRESGAVALQMAGSGASLRVQQMQARLKGLKVQCVSRCLPTPAPVALMCFGEPTTHTHTHTNKNTHVDPLFRPPFPPFHWVWVCLAGGRAAQASSAIWRESRQAQKGRDRQSHHRPHRAKGLAAREARTLVAGGPL